MASREEWRDAAAHPATAQQDGHGVMRGRESHLEESSENHSVHPSQDGHGVLVRTTSHTLPIASAMSLREAERKGRLRSLCGKPPRRDKPALASYWAPMSMMSSG